VEAGSLREELDEIRLGCLWQNVEEIEVKTLCHVMKTGWNDIQRQRFF
jgi:hypothetical protein